MLPTKKVDYLVEKSETESDEEFIGKFIDKTYSYVAQCSLFYLKMDNKKHRLLSILQFLAQYTVMGFHFVLLIHSSFFLVDINFTLFMHNTHVALLTFLTATVVGDFQRHRGAFANLHRLMATDFYDYHEPKQEAVSKIRLDTLQKRRRLAVIPISACMATGAALLLANILDRQGTFDFTRTDNLVAKDLPYAFGVYPYNTSEGFGYYISTLLQVMHGLSLAVPIGMCGWTYIVQTQSIIEQLMILMVYLENVEDRTKHMYERLFPGRLDGSTQRAFNSKEFLHCYNKCLSKNFQHHQVIISGFAYLQELFSVPVFLAYMVGTFVIALSLLTTGSGIELPGTTLVSILLCFAEVGFMYLFSTFSQHIIDLSTDLQFTMYSTKWYYCDRSITQSIAVFQTMTLKPLRLTAGGIIPANMDTFGRVMNSAYSYYNLVNAFDISV